MKILILGLNHQIQPSIIPSGDNDIERLERDQKDGFTKLLGSLIENRRVQFIGEEVEHGVLSIANLVALERGCRYTNIEMSPDEKQSRNISADYSDPQSEYSPEQKARWHREMEEYMVRTVLAMSGDANSALILCGREHTDALAVLFRRAGNELVTSDLKVEPWYIENWLKPDRHAPTERRTHPRYLFTATVELVELRSRTVTKARTSDLSVGGCFVDTPNPFSIGETVKLRITKDQKTLEVRAKVVNSLVGSGMGLMFTDVQPEPLGMLEKWLGELSGESLPEPEGWGQQEQAPIEERLKDKEQYVLNELIIALMRKRVLTETEGQAMLRKLHR